VTPQDADSGAIADRAKTVRCSSYGTATAKGVGMPQQSASRQAQLQHLQNKALAQHIQNRFQSFQLASSVEHSTGEEPRSPRPKISRPGHRANNQEQSQEPPLLIRKEPTHQGGVQGSRLDVQRQPVQDNRNSGKFLETSSPPTTPRRAGNTIDRTMDIASADMRDILQGSFRISKSAPKHVFQATGGEQKPPAAAAPAATAAPLSLTSAKHQDDGARSVEEAYKQPHAVEADAVIALFELDWEPEEADGEEISKAVENTLQFSAWADTTDACAMLTRLSNSSSGDASGKPEVRVCHVWV